VIPVAKLVVLVMMKMRVARAAVLVAGSAVFAPSVPAVVWVAHVAVSMALLEVLVGEPLQ